MGEGLWRGGGGGVVDGSGVGDGGWWGKRRSPIPNQSAIRNPQSAMTRILIVDDDQTTLASIARAFKMAGYDAVVCDNAMRAITLLRTERFDLVFSDVVMPGRDGLSMLADLRDMGITTPVVMVSGQATVDMAGRATKLGAVDLLEQPLSA